MLARIKRFFDEILSPAATAVDPERRLRLTTAALLLEVASADFKEADQELDAITGVLREQFALADDDVEGLLDMAKAEQRDATSLYQFTRLINDHCSEREKFALILNLWKVAAADGDIDKYEDHLIRKLAELLYVPHSEFIRAKLAVLTER